LQLLIILIEDVDGFVVGRAGLGTTKLASIIRTLARNGEYTKETINNIILF
jgi:hypothetical protein